MIDARDLVYVAGGREILRGISATFAPRTLHLIVGPNGAGKSTLVKVLARLLRPARGTVTYQGADIAAAAERTLAVRRAVLSQAIEIAFPLSVREVVMMGRYPHFGSRQTSVDETICDEVMAYFEVAALADRSYTTLSGGERQRVNFARVLAQVWLAVPGGCRYLFLDEPLTFLDIRHQIDFMHKVRAFAAADDVVVVGVVHDLSLASRFADRLMLIDDGRVVADGPREAVLTAEHIQRVFGVEPGFVRDPSSGTTHLVF